MLADPSTGGCAADVALVASVTQPADSIRRQANEVTAQFCSVGGSPAVLARYVLDQPESSRGSLKVVAIDPLDPDSSRVIESGVVSYNGGVDGDFAPVILRVERSHPTTDLRVKAVGSGLSRVPEVQIAALDDTWRLALARLESSDTRLVAVTRMAADLPPSALVLDGAAGGLGAESLAPDTVSTQLTIPACVSYMREYAEDGHTHIQPKDFCVVASRDSFHIFYTRKDDRISNDDLNETIIGHKRSRNLNDWVPTTGTMNALQARSGQWDNRHVWAPHVFKKPGDVTYWMFYTGVRDTTIQGTRTQVQRIGIATSTDLNVWTPESTWVYSHNQAPSWAEQDTSLAIGQQFRDPFVMENPDTAGVYHMYVVGGSHDRHRMVVGVARSGGDLRRWVSMDQPLWNTDAAHTFANVVESPHAFRDPGGRWTLQFSAYNGPSDGDLVAREQNDFKPYNPDTTSWFSTNGALRADSLFHVLADSTLLFWHASEYIKWAADHEYMLAFNDNQRSVDISQVVWHGLHAFQLNDSCAPSVPLSAPPATMRDVALAVLDVQPSHGSVLLGYDLPATALIDLAIYDIQGRRLRRLISEVRSAGPHSVRWSGERDDGTSVSSGVYFVRLCAFWGTRQKRIVLVR